MIVHKLTYKQKRVLSIAILSVCPSIYLSRPGTDLSHGEVETVVFHCIIAQSLWLL